MASEWITELGLHYTLFSNPSQSFITYFEITIILSAYAKLQHGLNINKCTFNSFLVVFP